MSERSGRVLGLGHLLLQTVDLARAERFYMGLLNLTVKKRDVFRDGRPLVVTDQGLGLTEGRPAGAGPVEHIAFHASGIKQLARNANRMGIPIVSGPEPSAYGLSLYLQDPDGNKIEVFGDEEEV